MNNFTQEEKDLIYLIYYSINDDIPDKNIINNMNIEKIYRLSSYHMISAIISNALEKCDNIDNPFHKDRLKSVRNNLLYDIERNKILDDFEKEKIWYLPLKGINLKDIYPKDGMRQMSDNDILFDDNYKNKVKDIMLKHNYMMIKSGGHHDVYTKELLFNFEMHHNIGNPHGNQNIYEYYKNIKDKLIKDNNKEYIYRFTDEDFYICITIHEYKHYITSGMGIRALIDCYLYLKKYKELDFNYINKELRSLGIYEFENKRKKLAFKLFSSPTFELTNEEENMLHNYLDFGIYGNEERGIVNQVSNYLEENNSKLSYIIHRLFPNIECMKSYYPVLNDWIILLPYFYIYRLIYSFINKRNSIKRELKEVKGYDN